MSTLQFVATSSSVGLIDDALTGSPRALARLATLIERNDERSLEIAARIYPSTGVARRIGVTGPPGAGKSTLVNLLAAGLRTRGETVGVIAVDPSSPVSGGATLGDRIRMLERFNDSGVFIRSMASRGRLGGLSEAAPAMIHLFDAAGFNVVIVETVGVGQEEIDVSRYVETTVLVQPPGLGDSVQAMKAGILEVADIYVINKADLPGVRQTVNELRAMLSLGTQLGNSIDWRAPVISVSAKESTGVDEVLDAIDAHKTMLGSSSEGVRRRRCAASQEIQDHLDTIVRSRVSSRQSASDAVVESVMNRSRDPREAALALLSSIAANQDPA